MGQIRFTQSAWEDLDSITDYIAQDSLRYAEEFSFNVLERIEQLKEFPKSGRVVPEFKNEENRELIMGKYRIVYRLYSPNIIIILRIIHGAKLMY